MADQRIRTLTEKGTEVYEAKTIRHFQALTALSDAIDETISSDISKHDSKTLQEVEIDLNSKVQAYDIKFKEFYEFLSTTRSTDSEEKVAEQAVLHESRAKKIQLFRDKLINSMQSSVSVFSPARSHCSRHSSSSKAKSAAAQARLVYARKEAELKKQQSRLEEKQTITAAAAIREKRDLETELTLVKEEQSAAELLAEAEILEEDLSTSSNHSIVNVPQQTFVEKTKSFINSCVADTEMNEKHFVTVNESITKFLLRKDLAISRLTSFTDKPQDYQGWKASFKKACIDMDVESHEELDLLVKWLGPESRKHARSLKSSCAHDTDMAVELIWERLEERFGTVESVYAAVMDKIAKLSKIGFRESDKLYDLSDLLLEIQALKQNTKFKVALSYFDSSFGIAPIVSKLPHNLQERWLTVASTYKSKHDVSYPPFVEFMKFVQTQAKMRNDPSFVLSYTENFTNVTKSNQSNRATISRPRLQNNVTARKTGVIADSDKCVECALHKNTSHTTEKCRSFLKKSFNDKRQILRDNKLCFKCFGADHLSKDCKEDIVCSKCRKFHNTVMHIEFNETHGGEHVRPEMPRSEANNVKCTQICGKRFSGKSCAKIVLVNAYRKGNEDLKIKTYAIIDDQSNRTLAKPDLMSTLNLDSEIIEYSVNTCNGTVVTEGRLASDLVVESVDGDTTFIVPSVLECVTIPNERDEIPTPEVAYNYSHLTEIANQIPPVEDNVSIQLLIGRDLSQAHHVLDQKIGPQDSPYAQKLALGWVIIGETCLGRVHRPTSVVVNKISILDDGRPTAMAPCINKFELIEQYKPTTTSRELFMRHENDDKPGLSVEDREFLSLIDDTIAKDPSGKWTSPLPFKKTRKRLPNNRAMAKRRADLLDINLKKNPVKQAHFVDFMGKIFKNKHAEVAPTLLPNEECWYLPIFGVYHPKKPDQIRGVFDASAKYDGVSLNDVLMTGPDLTNNLLGILLRFRRQAIAVTGDIEQMFYSFLVNEEHRNYLRFFWYSDNNPVNPMIEYRMCVQVFGNAPSPAIATYGLRKSTENSDESVRDFVENEFYVDDALTSQQTATEAVELIKNTQGALLGHGLRLHKIASNSTKVMKSFHSDDLAKNIKDQDLDKGKLPAHRSLGVVWDLNSDSFIFQVSPENRPHTRRGILSTVNSIFDPVGFLAPVTLEGKLILRDITSAGYNWDEPLSSSYEENWERWQRSLKSLDKVSIPRQYIPVDLEKVQKKELEVYCDASEQAIAAVAYLVVSTPDNARLSSFVLGKTNVAPTSSNTIPRLELCAALLATEIGNIALEQLNIEFADVNYFSDSKVVLGYISNTTRRFHSYVSNRVDKIRRGSNPEQWNYIPTNLNPADCATRGVLAADVMNSPWLTGPVLGAHDSQPCSDFQLVNPDCDKEVRVQTYATKVSNCTDQARNDMLGTKRFERFSCWSGLKRAIANLQRVAKLKKSGKDSCSNSTNAGLGREPEHLEKAESLILRSVQQETYPEEYRLLEKGKSVHKSSPLIALNPFLDNNGVIRVGGRLHQSNINNFEKHPVIVPKKHHVATLLVRYYHANVKHEGRHFTEGSLRSNGYWIVGAKRLISSVIHRCVQCRKLRGKQSEQIMADLPRDRLEPAPPFTFVGVDAFGPWTVVTRKTRGGQANSKRWGILFTCLTIRAIDIEIVEEMSASAFINALRRFIAIHGNVKMFRSDRGTNFVGAVRELGINVCDAPVKTLLEERQINWVFNPPHASHMGGVWERMIGTVRRILDSTLAKTVCTITHDVLITLLAEVCAIVNARPIVPVSTDAEIPEILSPSAILTQKVDFVVKEQDLGLKDIYKQEWKRVQVLANTFWKRWRLEFLQQLQPRQKWRFEQSDLKQGDVVLVKDSDVARNHWPYGLVEEVQQSEDGKVRKLSVRIRRDGKNIILRRPISELVLLLSED